MTLIGYIKKSTKIFIVPPKDKENYFVVNIDIYKPRKKKLLSTPTRS